MRSASHSVSRSVLAAAQLLGRADDREGAEAAARYEELVPTVLRLLVSLEAERRELAHLAARPTVPAVDAAAAVLAGLPATPNGLGAAYAALLDATATEDDARRFTVRRHPARRRALGAFYTPDPLVACVLDATLEPVLDAACATADPGAALLSVTVCDPACGTGQFLVAATDRIARRLADIAGIAARHARRVVIERCVHGADLDPLAVELTRAGLRLAAAAPVEASLRVGDALVAIDWPREFPAVFGPGFDCVVGNPPFLNGLERRTAPSHERARELRCVLGKAVRGYTDASAAFLLRGLQLAAPGGLVGMVQPQSLLAARDAAGVRLAVSSSGALVHLWTSDAPVFDAKVLACAPTVRKGARQSEVRRHHGAGFRARPPRPATSRELAGEWGFLVAEELAIPRLPELETAGCVGDLAECGAGFRDEYYGLVPHVVESAPGMTDREFPPLVTTGGVDAARCRWGEVPMRFAKRRWAAPRVDLVGLAARDPALAAWARARLVPKVLVAPQGRVVEAVADPRGTWLPSVPLVFVRPSREVLWLVAAALLSPVVSAYAARRYAGAGLTIHALRLSARQVAALPLPARHGPWERAAALVAVAHGDSPRDAALTRAGALMCEAYGVEPSPLLGWWAGRARLTSS